MHWFAAHTNRQPGLCWFPVQKNLLKGILKCQFGSNAGFPGRVNDYLDVHRTVTIICNCWPSLVSSSGFIRGHKNPWSNGRLKTTTFGRWQRRDVGALSRTASRLTGHHCSENSLQSKLGPVAFGWPGFVFSCVWVGPNGKHEPGLGWSS